MIKELDLGSFRTLKKATGDVKGGILQKYAHIKRTSSNQREHQIISIDEIFFETKVFIVFRHKIQLK